MPTDLTLLFAMSALRRATARTTGLINSASLDHAQPPPPAETTFPHTPDSSRHSAVCCCLLCEQRGTGEQAMRAAGGDYDHFLAHVASPRPRTDAPGGASVAWELGHTSTKMTLGHVRDNAATATRVAAVEASLGVPKPSAGSPEQRSLMGGPTPSSLSMLSHYRDAGIVLFAASVLLFPGRRA